MACSIYIPDGFTCIGKVDAVEGLHPRVEFKYRPAGYAARSELNAAYTAEQKTDAVCKVVHSHLADVVVGEGDTRERVVLKLDDLKRIHSGIVEAMISFIMGSQGPCVEDEVGKSPGG